VQAIGRRAFASKIFSDTPAAALAPQRRSHHMGDSAVLGDVRPVGAANIGAPASISLHQEDVSMRNYDLSPLYRSTIGFDRLFSLLDQHSGIESAAPTYPPYNIERTGENAYRITIAVAGFADNELSIETRENTLTVRGSREATQKGEAEKREVLYQGIAARAFERRFQLADHVSATGATTQNGLLHIDLVREVPEAQKPRTLEINKVGKTVEANVQPIAKQAA
jgi:molecular chaperone IbpA